MGRVEFDASSGKGTGSCPLHEKRIKNIQIIFSLLRCHIRIPLPQKCQTFFAAKILKG